MSAASASTAGASRPRCCCTSSRSPTGVAALGASGVFTYVPSLDHGRAVAHREEVVAKLRGGVHSLLRSAGVEVVAGRGHLGEGGVVVGDSTIEARHVLVATGSSPSRPRLPGIDLEGVVDSDGMLGLTALPERVLVIGAGAVGCEWAAVLKGFGVDVVLAEMAGQVLPNEDAGSREGARAFTGVSRHRREDRCRGRRCRACRRPSRGVGKRT